MLTQEEMKALAEAMASYIAIGQANGDAEMGTNDIVALLENLFSLLEKKYKKYHYLWEKLHEKFPGSHDIAKEKLTEYRRMQWTTYENLADWSKRGGQDGTAKCIWDSIFKGE